MHTELGNLDATLHPDSNDSPQPSAMPSSPPDQAAAAPAERVNALLFLATVTSVLVTAMYEDEHRFTRVAAIHALQFAGSVLGILVAHESGHYVAARLHRVDASLPSFIPMPLPPFGTMGAVIRMRGTIPTRRALLDIGASGPLAGLVLAIPLYAWGFAHSRLIPIGDGGASIGESILATLLEHMSGRVIPAGMDVELSPVAFGAWAGLFVTMINLIPVGQLDGGHVAYALFGPRQNKLALIVHRSMLAFFFVSVASFLARDVRAGWGLHHIGSAVGNSLFWLLWFEVLAILGALSSRDPGERPRGDREPLPTRTRAYSLVGLLVLASVGRDKSSPLLWIAWFAGLGLLLAMEARTGVLRAHPLLDHPPHRRAAARPRAHGGRRGDARLLRPALHDDALLVLSALPPPPPGPPWDLPLADAPLAFLDLEMTGLDAANDRVVEVCVDRVVGGRSVERVHSLVRPDVRMGGASHVHGLDEAALADAPRFADLADRVLGALDGAALVAHAAEWDASFLLAEMERAGKALVLTHWIDTLVLARRSFAFPSYSLDALCRELQIDRGRAHRADADVAAMRHVFDRCTAVLAPQSVRDLWEVKVAQRRARASIVSACEAAVEHGLPVQIVYRPSRKPPEPLLMVLTEVRSDLDLPRVIGYQLPGRGRRDLRADRILRVEPPPS